ncbi:MAG TPA: membrane protein insertase YidC, partial [Chitinophagales bacterium]|nr:membrane protein insertase YidC [Chitinophagales bacterium]
MKNKETIIGWILIAALMIGFTYYQNQKFAKEQKQKEEIATAARQDSIKLARQMKPVQPIATTDSTGATPADSTPATAALASTDSNVLAQQYGAFAAAATGEEKTFVIENEVQKITLANKGGQIKSVELKNYKTWDKKPLILFGNKANTLSYQFFIDGNRDVDTKNLYFEPVGETFTVKGDSSKSFTLRATLAPGKYIEQQYVLKGNSYLLDYNINMVGLNTAVAANNTYINAVWSNTLESVEHNIELERRYSAPYYRYSKSDVEHLNEDKEEDQAEFDAPVEWISFKQQFFNITLFSKQEIQKGGKIKTHYTKDNVSYVKKYDANFTLPYTNGEKSSYGFQFYIGPNHFNTLASLDKETENIIKLGPDFWMFSWISYITRFIIWVFSWFDSVHLNYGIIILLMTLILKIALHPLTAKSIESAAKMKILAPELAALKEKYGDDQAKIGSEQMKIYQRAGVSPFGGCLPLLLQMPILMAMYYFFPASIELRQEAFLWASDLSSYDSIVTFATALPLIGNHISLFTILMTITSIGQAVMNNQMNAMTNQQPGMKYMPYFMPVLLMFMFNSFPAALTYYYLLQNLLGMAHQWIIQKFFINDEKLRKQIEENKRNPKP